MAAVTPGLPQTTEFKARATKTNQKCKSGLSVLLNYGGKKVRVIEMLSVEQNGTHLATPGTQYNKKCRTSLLVAVQTHTQRSNVSPYFTCVKI